MASRLPVPVLDGARFGLWARLAAGVVLAALFLLGAGNADAAARPTPTAAVPGAYLRGGRADDAAPRPAPLNPAPEEGDVPDGRARRGDREDAIVDRALDRGRALLDRYGSEKLLLAVVVGALVQVVCLVFVRLVGTILRLATRGLAWSFGVAAALYLLGGQAALPVSAAEAADRVRRLADLVGRVA
jgi:hypothetical protein